MNKRTRLATWLVERRAKEALRHHVRQRDRDDVRSRQWIGLDTFLADWQGLHALPAPAPTLSRKIWLLWLQGEAQAPDMIRTCINSWRTRNPGWDVEVIDEARLAGLIDLPDFPAHVAPNHKANVIRLRLLARYGGVWVDATTACQRPLDEWIDTAAQTGFFAFSRPQPIRTVANWFIAAAPGQPLLEAWRMWSEAYILSRRRARSYFWQHHTFDWMLERFPALQDQWADTPKISARGPHVVQRMIDGDLSPADTPTADQLARLPLLKLNRRKGYELSQIRDIFRAAGLVPPL